jgi:phosphomethylpyrimidine synthase
MTQLDQARAGVTTPEMKTVAEKEYVDVLWLRDQVSQGRVVIPANKRHSLLVPCGIGEGLYIKVNANIGTSSDRAILEEELEKLRVSIKAGADSVMDLSTGGEVDANRRAILKESTIPVGTVPIYQAVVETVEQEGGLIHLTVDKIFEVIERQAEDGVDFMTVHCGLTRDALEMLRKEKRVTDIVSRGGAFLTTWMLIHCKKIRYYT